MSAPELSGRPQQKVGCGVNAAKLRRLTEAEKNAQGAVEQLREAVRLAQSECKAAGYDGQAVGESIDNLVRWSKYLREAIS